jgi:diacylglycerol kinase family enzyme
MTQRGGRVTVLLNASAGRTELQAAELEAQLGSDLVDVVSVPPAALQDAVRRAVEGRPHILGIAGGDGSLHTAAAVLAGSGTTLAVVPTGTLNHFAQRVGIHSIDDAAEALRSGRITKLPVGSAGDRVFLNTFTFGEYSRIVRIRERFRPRLGKWPAAALAFTTALFSLRRLRLTISTPEAVLARRTPFVWVGVGWGSFPRVHEALERRSKPDLEVAVLASPSRMAGLGFLVRLSARMVSRQRPIRDRALEILNTRALTVDSGHRIDATADGEVLRLQPPIDIGIRDDALSVLVGPHFDSTHAVPRPSPTVV